MTKSARAWAWEQSGYTGEWGSEMGLSGPQKAVLVCLAELENYEMGFAFPSVAHIAERCCIADRTVNNALSVLEEAGFIARGKHRRENGTWLHNTYRLRVSASFRAEDATWIRIHGEPEPEPVASSWVRAQNDPSGYDDPTPI